MTDLMKHDGRIMKPTRDAAQIDDAVRAFKEQGANVLVAGSLLEEVPPDHRLVIRRLEFDPERDFYPTGGSGKNTRYAPSKRALESMASALGVKWRPDLSSRVPPFESNVAAFKSVAVAPDPATGEPRTFEATYELDLRDGSALHEQYLVDLGNKREQYGGTDQQWKVDKFEEAWRRRRRFVVALADTGARLRVIRQIAKVRSDYSVEEIKKPFVTVGMIYQPGIDTPGAAMEMARQAQAARIALYYGGAATSPGLVEDRKFRKVDPFKAEAPALESDEEEVDLARALSFEDDESQLDDESESEGEDVGEEPASAEAPESVSMWLDSKGSLSTMPEPNVLRGASREAIVFVTRIVATRASYDWQSKLTDTEYAGAPLDELPNQWLVKLYSAAKETLESADEEDSDEVLEATFDTEWSDEDIPFDV